MHTYILLDSCFPQHFFFLVHRRYKCAVCGFRRKCVNEKLHTSCGINACKWICRKNVTECIFFICITRGKKFSNAKNVRFMLGIRYTEFLFHFFFVELQLVTFCTFCHRKKKIKNQIYCKSAHYGLRISITCTKMYRADHMCQTHCRAALLCV